MSYKVLYRKYRPDSFNKIVGQSTIVDNLKRSIIEKSFSHAYIFTGPRGTGKTSTAKVLAKALTCSNSSSGEPCGECEDCKNFSTSPDIIEIDAASNNGVDEIRELRKNITLAPAASKYKIYIIDEVHMLSAGAFNALLKTLEEPPAHAIFILATTEVYKVPITILSRCQRFDFKKIDKTSMMQHLKEICEAENIKYESGVLEEIYDLSEGCLRDALSILDQASKQDKDLNLDGLLQSYNMISENAIKELLNLVSKNDTMGIIETIEKYEDAGMNAQKLLKKMINYLSKLAVDIKLGKNRDFSFKQIAKLIDNLNRCYIDARINENVYAIIKLCFIEATEIAEAGNQSSLRSETNESGLTKNTSKGNSNLKMDHETVVNQPPLSLKDVRINNCFAEANKEALNEITEMWKNIDNKKLAGIDKSNYKPVVSSKNYSIFAAEEDSLAKLFNIKKNDIEKNLQKDGINIKIYAIPNEEWLDEKEKYKEKIKSGQTYQYVEEPEEEKDDDSQIKKEVENLFTEKIVEIL